MGHFGEQEFPIPISNGRTCSVVSQGLAHKRVLALSHT